jgi:ribosomal protein L17
MSYTAIQEVPKSSQELDALLKDVQALLYSHQQLQQEHAKAKALIAEQHKLMEAAHVRLLSMLKRLPDDLPVAALITPDVTP